MKIFLLLLSAGGLAAASLRLPQAQPAASYCVDQFMETRPLGIAQSDAAKLVEDIARRIGVSRRVAVIPCDQTEKAAAWPDKRDPGNAKDYIIYNPRWVQEVIGKERVHAYALFGHELGHFINDDFGVNEGRPRREKETNADYFAGCAVARMNGDWTPLVNLLERLRGERPGDYPDRLKSIEVARNGYLECGGREKEAFRDYQAARGNLGAMRQYVDQCGLDCPYRAIALSDLAALEAAAARLDKERREATSFRAAQGNAAALRRYLNDCDICADAVAARTEIASLDREAALFDLTICNRTDREIKVATRGRREPNSQYQILEGWYPVQTGNCTFIGKWVKERIYAYVETSDWKTRWPTEAAADTYWCVSSLTLHEVIRGARSCQTGIERRVPFFAVDPKAKDATVIIQY